MEEFLEKTTKLQRFEGEPNGRLGIFCPIKSLANALGDVLSCRYSIVVATDIEAVHQYQTYPFIFFLDDPSVQICNGGGLTSEALDDQHGYRLALDFYRQNRARVKLISIDDLRQGVDDVLWYFHIDQADSVERVKSALPDEVSPILRTLVHLYLLTDPVGVKVVGEFDASRTNFSSCPFHRERFEKVDQAFRRVNLLLEENSLVKDQQHSMFSQVEKLYSEKELALSKKSLLQDEIDQLKLQNSHQSTKLKDLERTLEITENVLRERDAILEATSRMAIDFEDRVNQLESSHSFKITRPLRALRRIF